MLLQFAVENFRSFRDRAVLSMLADPRVEHGPGQVLEGLGGQKVLRAAAVYGANGSGKSNLIKALSAFQRMILEGTRAGEKLPVTCFSFDPERRKGAAHFEIEVEEAGRRFSYGIEVKPAHVEAEWLYEVDADGAEHLLFERQAGGTTRPITFTFGDRLALDEHRRAFLGFVAEGTRQNQPFLAEASQRNVTELAPFLESIRELRIVWPDAPCLPLIDRIEADADFRKMMTAVLHEAGTGVTSVKVESREIPPTVKIDWERFGAYEDWYQNTFAKEHFRLHKDEQERVFATRLKSLYHATNGEIVELDMREESDGTRRLLNLAPIFHMATKEEGELFAIDEMERSLHPQLTRLLLQLFFARADKGAAAQIIFTTHDTNLLDLRILPRDSVWFTEKDPAGGTVLYPLSDLDHEQITALSKQSRGIEMGYLQGRFGAVPFFGSLEALGFRKEDLK